MSVTGAGEAAAPEATPAEGAQEAPGGVPADFAQRFEQFAEGFEGLPDRIGAIEQELQQRQQQAPPEQRQAPDSRYLLDPDSGYFFDRLTSEWLEQPPGDYGSEHELTADAVQQMIQDGIRQGLEPYARQQLMQHIGALEDEYPDLRDPKIAGEIKAEAQRIVQATMPGAHADAWKNPTLIEKLYLARQAGQRAEEEVPPDGQPSTVLEDPAAAAATAKELEDEGDAIVNAGRKGQFFR